MAAVLAASAACSPVVSNRGNLVPDERVAQVAVGVSSQSDVAALLGPPTTVATFDPNTWYYVGEVQESRIFGQPETIQRRVLVARFDARGTLASLDELGLEDGQSVEVVDRETPTLGRRMTFLEQMLGNLGRFNTPEN